MIDVAPPSSAASGQQRQSVSASPLPPAALPVNDALLVQVLESPPGLLILDRPLNLPGALQLTAENHLLLQTARGNILLNLPVLQNNPTLTQWLRAWLESNQQATLQLAPGAAKGEAPQASLWLGQAPAVAASPAASVSANSSRLIGETLEIVILPQAPSAPANPVPVGGTKTGIVPPTGLASASAATPDAPALPVSGASGAGQQPQIIHAQFKAVIPPGQPLPPPAPGEFLATITGFSPVLQQPLAANGASTLLLKTPVNIPAGSVILFGQAQPALPAAEIAASDESWSALRQFLTLMQEQEFTPLRALAAQMAQRTPQMDASLSGAMLFMLSALNRGDMRQWIGARRLEDIARAGKSDLLAALQEEMRHAAGTTADAVVGQWRSYHLPWLDNGHIMPMHIYVHHDRDKDRHGAGSESQDNGKTRFVIDITFTRLGAMQLDGFVQHRPTAQIDKPPRTQFDLILRSMQTLPPPLREELRGAFNSALAASGYTGQLQFQPGVNGWMKLGARAGLEARQV